MTATTTAPQHRDTRQRPALKRRPAPTPPAHESSAPDIVDVWGNDSFPASDAPANW